MTDTSQTAIREFKLYDKSRASDWTALVGPTQCAVLLKEAKTANPLNLDGSEVAHIRDYTFFVFDHLDDARDFCGSQVQKFPYMCCDIYDSAGKAKSPMLVIMHPSTAAKDELSPASVKRRKWAGIVCSLAAVILFAVAWRSEFERIWPAVVGINLFFFGLRLLYWSSASAERARESAKQVEKHLRRERGEESPSDQNGSA